MVSDYNCFLHKPVEGWEAFDLKTFAEGVVLGGVDLGKVDWGVSLGENGSCGGVFRGELLAVSAVIKES